MGHDVHVVIEERGHNGEYQVPVPGIRYCSVTHITHAAALIPEVLLRTGEGTKGEGKTPKTSKNTSDKPATKNPGTGKRAIEEAKNRSAPHPGKRVWEGLQTKEC